MHPRVLAALHAFSRPHVALPVALVVAGAFVGGAWYLTSVSATGAYTPAAIAPITEEVDATGAIEGAETTDLSFQISGQVAGTPVPVGTHVYAGQVLVSLSGGSQAASLAGAQANLEAAQARLAALEAGTRSEQIAVDQQAVRSAANSAYVAADGAVHTTVDQLFTNPRVSSATLILNVPDSELADRLTHERVALEPVLASLGTAVGAAAFTTGDPASVALQTAAVLRQVSALLDDGAAAVSKTQPSASVSASTLAGYSSSIGAARTAIASGLAALTSAQGALTLAQAPATATDLAAAKASVDAAQAAVDAAKVSAGQTALVAPISGTVTVQSAHKGATVAPGVPVVSMQGDAGFEAKVLVSESDIGKIKVGQSATATFDAYQGASFPATVTAVDPAATVVAGVSSYQVTLAFVHKDPRIQSGLTAHIAITTASKPDALVIPRSAVITEGSQHFVYLREGKGNLRTPIELGVYGSDTVEVLSGLSAGAQVLTFGASQ